MTEPKENEEVNDELSSEEMKSVSGGISDEPAFRKLSKVDSKYAISDEPAFSPKPEGSGSGLTKGDWDRKIRRGGDSTIGGVPIGEGENSWWTYFEIVFTNNALNEEKQSS